MMTTLKIHSRVDGVRTPYDGAFVVDYDPTIGGLDKDGVPWVSLTVTWDPNKAKRFETADKAIEYWRQTTGGFRLDGQPDRPLTVFNCEIAAVEGEQRKTA